MGKDLKDFKIITEDNKEYVVVTYITREKTFYGMLTNLNDELDSMFVKFNIDGDNITFDKVDNDEIISDIMISLL